MIHPIYRIVRCEPSAPYALKLDFNDGKTACVDLSSVLEGQLYGPLRDSALFQQVRLNPEVGTVEWPNGADFDPAILHDWDKHKEAFSAMARKWKLACSSECASDAATHQT